MKRSIVLFLMALAIALNVGLIPAWAKSGNVDIVVIENETTVTYEVNLTPGSDVNAADITISYDPNQLAVNKVQKGALASSSNALIAANHVAADGVIYVSYASLDANIEGGTICTMTFDKLEGYQAAQPESTTEPEPEQPIPEGQDSTQPSETAGLSDASGTSESQQTAPISGPSGQSRRSQASAAGSGRSSGIQPAIGVEIVGMYNEAGKVIEAPVVTGGAGVAVVATGKKVTDADANPQLVAESKEIIPEDKKGVAKNSSSTKDNDLLAETEQEPDNKNDPTTAILIAGAVVGIAMVATAVVLLIRKRG